MRENLLKGISLILSVFLLFLLVGCGKEEQNVSFQAQYIRTDGIVEDEKYPIVEKIQSKDELEKYYQDHLDQYNFSDNTTDSISFTTAIDKYDEDYFKDSFLLIALVKEDSGSIFHTVTQVLKDGTVSIEKTNPDDGSTDIATWHILIEMDKKYQDIDFHLAFDEVSKESY